ncbi:MAG: PilW family protein [Bacillota bacterium]
MIVKNNFSQRGYSLIEVLFVVVIFSLIGLAVIQISNFSWDSYTYNKQLTTLQSNTIAIEQIANKVRNALEIKINKTGTQLILKEKTNNNQLQYSRYLLKNNNLYLETNQKQLNFIQNLSTINNLDKTVIGKQCINNTKNLFSINENNLFIIKFKFDQQINFQNNRQNNIKKTLARKVYPRNTTININSKIQNEVSL